MSAQMYGRGSPASGVQFFVSSPARPPGFRWFETHDIGSSGTWHRADHPETRNRWAGSVHESVGANIRSCSV